MARQILKRLADSGVKSHDANYGMCNDNFGELFLRRKISGPRCVLLGSSITAGSSGISNEYWQHYGSITEVMCRLAGLNVVRNAGVAGNRSYQMVDRYATDVKSYRPDIVIIEPLANDLQYFAADLSTYVNPSDTRNAFDNVVTLIKKTFETPALPVLVITPPNNTTPLQSARTRLILYDIAKFYGIPVIDIFNYMVDPTTTGSYQSAYSSDGIHPNAAGIAACAEHGKSVLTNLSKPTANYFGLLNTSAFGDMANIIRNGNMALGSLPSLTGFTVNTTNVNVTAPAATLPRTGRTFTYEKTASGLAYALSGGDFTLTGGHTYEFGGIVGASGLTPATATGFSIMVALSGVLRFAPLRSWVHNGSFEFSEHFTVPTSGTFEIMMSASDAATYTVNNLTLVDVTAMRAIFNPGW